MHTLPWWFERHTGARWRELQNPLVLFFLLFLAFVAFCFFVFDLSSSFAFGDHNKAITPPQLYAHISILLSTCPALSLGLASCCLYTSFVSAFAPKLADTIRFRLRERDGLSPS